MFEKRITMLGGGNTALSLAANLALAGHEVLIGEHPDFAATLDPIRANLLIRLEGTARTGAARIAAVTTDPAEALAWSDLPLSSVRSYAHAPFVAQFAPHLRPGHALAVAGAGRGGGRGRHRALRLPQDRALATVSGASTCPAFTVARPARCGTRSTRY